MEQPPQVPEIPPTVNDIQEALQTPFGTPRDIVDTGNLMGSWEALPLPTDDSFVLDEPESELGMAGDYTSGEELVSDSDLDDHNAYIAFHDEAKGFGVLDSGATSSFGSVSAADQQQQIRMESEHLDYRPPRVDITTSNSFRFGSGTSLKATSLAHLPIDNEALKTEVPISLFMEQPRPTPLMLGIDFMRTHRMVIDYEDDLVIFKDKPDDVYQLRQSEKGLLMMPMCGQTMQKTTSKDGIIEKLANPTNH